MKRRMLIIGTALLGLVGVGAVYAQSLTWSVVHRMVRSNFPEVKQISTDSLAARLSAPDLSPPLLLDVRTEAEFAVSRLRGAVRVDPEAPDLAFLDTLARDAPIVAYCSVGYRSSKLVRTLREKGFTNVSNLEGSIFQWANEGRPVYRDGKRVRQVHPYDRVWGMLLQKELRAYAPAPSN